MNFNKNDYERLSESLQTSEVILFAIEKVSGEPFERGEYGHIIDNAAGELWEEGGRLDEILAALQTEDARDGDCAHWSDLRADFDGEKWEWVD